MDSASWDAYAADKIICHACAATDRRKASMRDGKGDSDGMYVAARRIDDDRR